MRCTRVPHLRSASLRPAAAVKGPERPTLDDVQRLSEGKAARSKRGWGSRQVPHRLNAEERLQYNIARDRGFLTLKGSGYRRERKGSPLANIWRQLSDAEARPCVAVEQQGPLDTVVVDLSTLRLLDTAQARGPPLLSSEKGKVWEAILLTGIDPSPSICLQAEAELCSVAGAQGASPLPLDQLSSPFTVIVPGEAMEEWAEVAEGEGGLSAAEEHALTAPIWQQRPQLMCFQAERPAAKALGKALGAWRPGTAAAAAAAAAPALQ